MAYARFVTTYGSIEVYPNQVVINPKGKRPPILIVGPHLRVFWEFLTVLRRTVLFAGSISFDRLHFFPNFDNERRGYSGEGEYLTLCIQKVEEGEYYLGIAKRPGLEPKKWLRRMRVDTDFLLQCVTNAAERALSESGPLSSGFTWAVSGVDGVGRVFLASPRRITYMRDASGEAGHVFARENMMMWLNIAGKGFSLAIDEPGGCMYGEKVAPGVLVNIDYLEDKKIHVEIPETYNSSLTYEFEPNYLSNFQTLAQVLWLTTPTEDEVFIRDDEDDDEDEYDED